MVPPVAKAQKNRIKINAHKVGEKDAAKPVTTCKATAITSGILLPYLKKKIQYINKIKGKTELKVN